MILTNHDLLFFLYWAGWSLLILLALVWATRRVLNRIQRTALLTQSAYERRAGRLEDEVLKELRGLEIRMAAKEDAASAQMSQLLLATRQLSDEHLNLIRHELTQWMEPLETRMHDRMSALVTASDLEHRTRQMTDEVLAQVGELVVQMTQLTARQTPVLAAPRSLVGEALPLREHRMRMDRLQNDLSFLKNRVSSYLGGGAGLTYLVDETPIYINTDDFGCPSNFLNGGRYEEEYLQVLASFRQPNSTFLDIGANLGVFSLRLAPMMRHGRIHAFEPNSRIHELFTRSVHLNGLTPLIQIHQCGLSDREAEMVLAVPDGHAGGASVIDPAQGGTGQRIVVRRMDDVLSGLGSFDLAKIDVEGHELHALRGMSGLLERSPRAVILFEKLNAHSGIERELEALFTHFGMAIHRIDGVELVRIDLADFELAQAYFLAARPDVIGSETHRNFIEVFPQDLFAIRAKLGAHGLLARGPMPPDSVIFHGPYWYLPKGSYRMAVHASIGHAFKLVLAEQFGFAIAEFQVESSQQVFDFIAPNDLTRFEVVGRSLGEEAGFDLSSIRLTRLG